MSLKSSFKKFGKFVDKNKKKIVGGIAAIGGAVLTATGVGAAIGGPLVAAGAKLATTVKKAAPALKVVKAVQQTVKSAAPAKAPAPSLPPNKTSVKNQDLGNKKIFGLGNKVTKSASVLESVKEAALKTSQVVDVLNQSQEEVNETNVPIGEKKSFFKNPLFLGVAGVVVLLIGFLIIRKKK